MSVPSQSSLQRGMTLIEVLVTILILSVGLLGMAALQARLQQSEMEAYQRSQALLLLNDMANRLTISRNNVAALVTGTTSLGANTASCASLGNTNKVEWCSALQGAGEVQGSSKLGAMIGGRGCVESLGGGEYLVTVAWQGLGPLSAPPASVACGKNQYDGGSGCTDDMCRRVVTTIVRIANL
ncbi:type IV pilus modification protein PilV [Pseudomonas sp. BN515]|uniref:type IV pilus modification protein PilV n=1 Tax=Pseudomonas sp. BN515 TaxID=2567892 RepID=UPI002454FB2E|nr:type IV pilus modification protein PilV [Pseudomonas sp. BN515]